MARQEGRQEIRTTHLFAGMLRDEQGPLVKGLRRLDIHFKMVDEPEGIKKVDVLTSHIQCSKNANEILLLAHANVVADKRDWVSDTDLLVAFVRQGGGGTGPWLRKQGLVMEALIGNLILDNGELNISRFDDASRRIIIKMTDYARNKAHERLDPRHLLYAMLIIENGELPKRLREQGMDAEQLADMLYIKMPAGAPAARSVEAKAVHMSYGLLKIICMADSGGVGNQGGSLCEPQLLEAFLTDGGGEAGRFLVEHGVRLNKLI
jgi:ATP-dependent Clp protease ATP-binding subunit ClpA